MIQRRRRLSCGSNSWINCGLATRSRSRRCRKVSGRCVTIGDLFHVRKLRRLPRAAICGAARIQQSVAPMPRMACARLPAAPLWSHGDRGACIRLRLQPWLSARLERVNTHEASATYEDGWETEICIANFCLPLPGVPLIGIGVGSPSRRAMCKANSHIKSNI
jgi:hypothetical protein